jgi:hypothetical protein
MRREMVENHTLHHHWIIRRLKRVQSVPVEIRTQVILLLLYLEKKSIFLSFFCRRRSCVQRTQPCAVTPRYAQLEVLGVT